MTGWIAVLAERPNSYGIHVCMESVALAARHARPLASNNICGMTADLHVIAHRRWQSRSLCRAADIIARSCYCRLALWRPAAFDVSSSLTLYS